LFVIGSHFSREIMARERSDAAAVESMAATGAGYRRREDASPGRPGTAKRFSVCEGAVVVLTIGGTMVHARIVKMEQSSLLGSSKQRRSAKRNTRDAFEARRQRRASAARAMADSVPPGLGLEQMEQRQMEEEVVQQQQRQQQRTKAKRAAVGDEGASPSAPRRQRVQVAQREEVVATAAVPRVMCGRERVVEVTPAVKVARRGPEDDAASAGVAARERRRQDERDAILLGKSDGPVAATARRSV
jgi:hypothetical protein